MTASTSGPKNKKELTEILKDTSMDFKKYFANPLTTQGNKTSWDILQNVNRKGFDGTYDGVNNNLLSKVYSEVFDQ